MGKRWLFSIGNGDEIRPLEMGRKSPEMYMFLFRCFTQSNDLRRHERNVHMRGKLYSYKTPVPRQPPVNPGHMNLAAYQAFALQQRALLQHALSYESLMQNAAVAVTAPHFMPRPEHMHHAMAMTKQSDVNVTTSTPTTNNAHLHQPRLPPDDREASFKIEQVTKLHAE